MKFQKGIFILFLVTYLQMEYNNKQSGDTGCLIAMAVSQSLGVSECLATVYNPGMYVSGSSGDL